MHGPFPGMDPYLEAPQLWPGVQQGLMTSMASALNALLPERYVASLKVRAYVVMPNPKIVPVIAVRERPGNPAPGGTSSAVVGDPPLVLDVEPDEIHEPFIEIITVGDETRVVAVIEVLSPANKAARSVGRRRYLAKQREVLASTAHLLEIDLLRRGRHVVVAPHERVLRRTPYDYLASLSRGG